ncbi:MAG: DUF2067 domain-containing protein [archaeon GB-1867-035]|nr:DUF2067 domain-containing protein [Candidatus Culexmicrobium profundum]
MSLGRLLLVMGDGELRRAVERVFKISVSGEDDLLKLLELICNRLSFVDYNISSRPGFIKVVVRGSHEDVKYAADVIKELTLSVRRKSRLIAGGFNVFSVREISKMAGMAISLDLLAEALRLKGFKCRVVRNSIETNASEDVVSNVLRLMSSAYLDLRFETKSSSVKRLLVLASSVTGVDLWSVVEVARELEFISRDDEGRLVLLREWRDALKRLLPVLREFEVDEFSSANFISVDGDF